MEDKGDRRVRYTKALLRHALVELMQTHHISRISVKMLCDRADVHRSTFYAHYRDQYDLLAQVEQEVFENVKGYLGAQRFDDGLSEAVQKVNRILEYAKENADLLTALFSENSDISFQRDIVKSLDIVSLAPEKNVDEKTRDYVILFGISGCLSIITKWLQDGTREPTMRIAELMIQVLFKGIDSI